jgi:hypothetical protein
MFTNRSTLVYLSHELVALGWCLCEVELVPGNLNVRVLRMMVVAMVVVTVVVAMVVIVGV